MLCGRQRSLGRTDDRFAAALFLISTLRKMEATDAITWGLRHLRLASEGFSLSAANADQELPAT